MREIPIDLTGSLQNPAFSPDGKSLSFTRWHAGYNEGASDVGIVDIETLAFTLFASGGTNVSQPGSCWNATINAICFSSDTGSDSDWPCFYDVAEKKIIRIMRRPGVMGYEPSWAPDGARFVFEQHAAGQEGQGRIVIYDRQQKSFQDITTAGDCRQPNWSADGKLIVWQRNLGGDRWQLELYDVARKTASTLAFGTDATFGPGNEVLYSDNDGALRTVSRALFKVAGRYAGAASWSSDGKRIAFETCRGDPDGGAGTQIAVIDL